MTVKDLDKVRENKGLPEPLQWFGRRERLWAWCWVTFTQREGVNPAGYLDVQLRNEFINRYVTDVEWVSNVAKSQLLPIMEFGWIKDKRDRRQEIWLSSCTLPALDPSFVTFIDGIPGLSIKEKIVLRFDLSNVTLDAKLNTLRQGRDYWNNLVSESSQLKWLDKSNAKQCEWAWSYIRKTAPTGHLRFSLIGDDPYIAVLSVFDSAFSHPAERTLFFTKMHDAWNQFKHREKNTNKTQCNFWLATEAKAALDKLAAHKGMKKNQLIEHLIYQELHKQNTGL